MGAWGMSFVVGVLCSQWFVLVLLTATSLVILLSHGGAGAHHAFHMEQQQCVCESEPTKHLIKLHEPWHHFDSNHWFHIAEYYLSRHRFVDSRMPRNSSLYIMTSDPTFAGGLTQVTLFLMQMAFKDGTSRRIDVFTPSTLQWQNPTVRSFHSSGPVISYDVSLAMADRYLRHLRQVKLETAEQCFCGKYLGEFGSAPIDRGFWFNGPRDVEHMRRKVERICKGSEVLLKSSHETLYEWYPPNQRNKTAKDSRSQQKNMFKIVLYQRDNNRKFLDFEALLRRLDERLAEQWRFFVILHHDDLHPCLLSEALKDADIFLTTHGFQSTSALFMKEGSVLFECFPYKYWKEGYQHLAWEYGLHHRWIQQPHAISWDRKILLTLLPQSVCMKYGQCRSYARGDDVRINEEQLNEIILTAKKLANGELSAMNTELRNPRGRFSRALTTEVTEEYINST